MLTIVILAILIALLFDFYNGMNDAANSIATIVSTRVLSPRGAVLWAAFFNFAAYFFFGLHVANTMGKGIVQPDVVDEFMILASVVGALIWVAFCTHYGLPISVSHSLTFGFIGAGFAKAGFSALILGNSFTDFMGTKVFQIIIFIAFAPMIGMFVGYLIMVATFWIFRKWAPLRVDKFFRIFQLVSSSVYSLGHGSNDAQKTMGIIAVLLFSSREMPFVRDYLFHSNEFYVPAWVVFLCYITIAMGTLVGGWKVIKTLGIKLTHLKPQGGFSAETASALTLIGTAMTGIPVSTTHTTTGAILGVGMTKRFSAVKWGVARNIVLAWIFTIPAAAVMSAISYWIIRFLLL